MAYDNPGKKKIFHFDIKPKNILIMGNKIKVADFG
jgi:serine/threonine protein kinase